MKTASLRRPMARFGPHHERNLVNLPKNRFVAPASGTQTATDDTFAKQLVGVTISLLIGLFALWLCLAILGLMGLENFDREFLPSLTMRMAVASALALILCIDGLPLIVPWFIAFLPAYFLSRASLSFGKRGSVLCQVFWLAYLGYGSTQ
jgi:hypothetical protein